MPTTTITSATAKPRREEADDFTYTANALNQYTGITENDVEFTPTFDADGNQSPRGLGGGLDKPEGFAPQGRGRNGVRPSQTRIKTSTGIWTVVYNALNRPVTYTRENADGTQTVITADYDYMGRRVFKKVETVTPADYDSESGEETRTIHTHHRYLYRGYLQIATLDLTRSTLNDLWLITWDPTESPRGLGGGLDKPEGFAPQGRAANGVAASQPVATRPLDIQQSGTWYIYGTDLPKNVTELYSTSGYIHTAYTYYAPARPAAQGTPSQVCSGLGVWLLKPHPAPYGLVTAGGNITQPLQWSSEYADTDLGLVYYNYRHYNPLDGRWCGRDPLFEQMLYHNYSYCLNYPEYLYDQIGQKVCCAELTDADYGTCVRVKVKTIVRWALFGSTVVEWRSGASNAITKGDTFRGYPEVILEATWMNGERCKEIKNVLTTKSQPFGSKW